MKTMKNKRGIRLIASSIIIIIALLLLPSVFRTYPASSNKMITNARGTALLLGLKGYHDHYDKYPQGSLSCIMQILLAKNTDSQNSKKIVFFYFPPSSRTLFSGSDAPSIGLNGNLLDAWGSPFQLKIHDNIINIKSVGSNQLDDHGQKDDIVLTEQYPPIRKVKKP